MNASSWANASLWVAILAPVAALVPAFATPTDPERWGRAGCGVAAAVWGVLLVTGQHPHVGSLAPDELALAGATGVALLGARAAGATAAPVTAITIALAVGHIGDPSTAAPLLGITVAAVLVTIAGRNHLAASGAVAGAALFGALGLHVGGRGGAAIVVLAAAVAAAAGAFSPRSPLVVVVPAALIEAMRIGPQLAGTSGGRWVAVILAIAATVVVAAPHVDARAPVVPPVAGALVWVVVAAAGPFAGTGDAARALAAGAVLALLLGGPLALAATLPGVVVLVDAIAAGAGVTRLALAVAGFVLLAAIGAPRELVSPRQARPRPVPVDAVALLLALWLLLRPSAWTWLRVTGLQAYTEGVALAAAAGLVAGVVLFGGGATWQGTSPARLLLDTPAAPTTAPAHARRVVAGVAAATGIVAALLVRSTGL